jgi:hypothetical protein
VGTWRGTSLCQVKESSCHDETVVYHISKTGPNQYQVIANKIVNGKEEGMGVLDFGYNAQNKTIVCMRNDRFKSVWKLTLKGDMLTGSLTVNGNVLFRLIEVKKAS